MRRYASPCPPLKLSQKPDGEQAGKEEHGKLSSGKITLEKNEHEVAREIYSNGKRRGGVKNKK